MIKSSSILVLLTVAILSTVAEAQLLGTYRSGGDRYRDLCTLDNPAAMAGDGICPEVMHPTPPLPPSVWPAGAVTANHPGRVVFATDGSTAILRIFHPASGAPGGPLSLPPLPIPGFYAGSVVTGMTMDSATQTIYLTSGNQVTAHDPSAGMAMIGGPWWIPGLNFVVGLDYDSCSNTLLAVDSVGGVGSFSFGAGSLIMLAYVPWGHFGLLPAGAQATGVAIDRCVNSPCAGVPPAYYVAWTSGQVIQDTGLEADVGASPLLTCGLSYVAMPIRLGSAGSALGLTLRSRVGRFLGDATPNSLGLYGIAGVAPAAILAVDPNHIVGGAPLPGGETLWVNPGTATLIPVPVIAGAAVLPIPPLPYGLRFFAQWAVIDGGVLDLSDGLQLEIARP